MIYNKLKKILLLLCIFVAVVNIPGDALSQGDIPIEKESSSQSVTFRDDFVMLIDEEPYFPIGVFTMNNYPQTPPWNSWCFYMQGSPYRLDYHPEINVFFDMLRIIGGRYRIKNPLEPWPMPEPVWNETLYQRFREREDEPNFLGYLVSDEPVWNWDRREWNVEQQHIQEAYTRVKTDTPDKPVWINYCAAEYYETLHPYAPESVIINQWVQKRNAVSGYSRWADIISVDVYNKPAWFTNKYGVGGRWAQCDPTSQFGAVENPYFSVVGDYVDLMRERVGVDAAGRQSKAVWMIVQAWGGVTESEIRYQTWQAIIHGATGVWYWCTWGPWALERPAVDMVTSQALALHDVLVAPTVEATVTSEEGIETMVKQHNGQNYIFSVSREPLLTGKNVVFDVSGFGIVDGLATLVDEGRTIEISNGQFTLYYDPFDTHIISFYRPVPLPPWQPEPPQGPRRGVVGKPYTYTAKASDPYGGDTLYYLFDWGDKSNNMKKWLGPYSSGDMVRASHRWSARGIYHVKVKVKNEAGYESSWSNPLTVWIRPSRLFNW